MAKDTLVVVEHDRDTMEAADWLVDLGPGAGRHGGRLVAAGTPAEATCPSRKFASPRKSATNRLAGRR